MVSRGHAPYCLGSLSPLICSRLFRNSVCCCWGFLCANVSPWFWLCFLVGRMCNRIICTHHPRSLTHNSTMTSADGICLLPSMTDPSNLEPKDMGHRPCQRRMTDSSSHELGLNWQITSQNLSSLWLSFLSFPYFPIPSISIYFLFLISFPNFP